MDKPKIDFQYETDAEGNITRYTVSMEVPQELLPWTCGECKREVTGQPWMANRPYLICVECASKPEVCVPRITQ